MKVTKLAFYRALISFLVLVLVSITIFFLLIMATRQLEHVLEHIYFGNFRVLFQYVKNRINFLDQANESTFQIANILSSSNNLSTALDIKTKVVPWLFMTFTMLPWVSELSYIGLDGLLFSYYHEGIKTYMIFSNISHSSNGSVSYKWYSQQMNVTSSHLYGDVVPVSQEQLNKSKWFQDALHGKSGNVSWGEGLGNAKEPMIFFTAPVSSTGVISLGIGVKSLANNTIDLHDFDGYLLLSTKYGQFLGQTRLPETHTEINDYTASNQDHALTIQQSTNYSCQIDDFASFSTNSYVDILGERYKIGCAHFNVAGIQMVLVMALYCRKIVPHFLKIKAIILLLVSSIICSIFIGTYIIMQISLRYRLQEASLRANLIKQKEATQQAERKSMNKSMAFASASHDIRTSLAGITGLTELCEVDAPADSELRRNLEQMNACASKLLGILNSVLDISKVEAGKVQLEEVEFDMAQILEESVDIFHVVAFKKSIEVIWDPCDGSVLESSIVIGDCRRFKQIIDNLLGNAVKFTSEGHVIIRAWAKKPSLENYKKYSRSKFHFPIKLDPLFSFIGKNTNVYDSTGALNSAYHDSNSVEFVFEIDDSGIGIPIEKAALVFENYVQVKESSAGEPEGTGLGLGIVQSYVRLMGGEISIKPKELGERGTCFRFNIFLKSKEKSLDVEGEGTTLKTSFASAVDIKQKASAQSMAFRRCSKIENTYSLLLVRGSETSKILQKWLESLGINACEIDHEEILYLTLEKIKDNLVVSRKFDSRPGNNLFNRSKSHKVIREKGDQYSNYKDEAAQTLPYTTKEACPRVNSKGSFTCILFIIDMNCGSFSKMNTTLKNFASSIPNVRCKFVWLVDSNISDSTLRILKQRSSDLILQKPCHGSRLYSILSLLEEIEETNENHLLGIQTTKTDHDELNDQNSNKSVMFLKLEDGSTHDSSMVKHEKDDSKPLSGMKVLLVEDTLVLRHLTTKMLSRLGAIVESSENGSDALHLIREAMRRITHFHYRNNKEQGDSENLLYDVVLMDCEMPVMNGYEATRQIREEEKLYGLHIPIIALTAHATIEEEKRTILSGMDFHLTKPLDANKLMEVIKLVCQK